MSSSNRAETDTGGNSKVKIFPCGCIDTPTFFETCPDCVTDDTSRDMNKAGAGRTLGLLMHKMGKRNEAFVHKVVKKVRGGKKKN